MLGYEKSRQPDWFQESADELRLQLQWRNNAYDRWLASGKEEDLTRFKVAKNEVRKSIREKQKIAYWEPRHRRQKESVWGEEGVEVHKRYAVWKKRYSSH